MTETVHDDERGHGAGDRQQLWVVGHRHHGGAQGGRIQGGALSNRLGGNREPIDGCGTTVSGGGTGGTEWVTDLGHIEGLEAWC